MTSYDVDALYQRIGKALIEEAPKNWTRLATAYRRVGKTGESQATATLEDGSVAWIQNLSMDFTRAFRELRKSLYQEGKGAWYSAIAIVTSDGRITIDFDYDNEPVWDIPIVPLTYVEDLEMFPRDLEHQPAWLREKIREANA